MFRRLRPRAVCGLAAGLAMLLALPAGPARVKAAADPHPVNPDDVLYVMPYWFGFASASEEEVVGRMEDLRRRLGPEGPYVKYGFSAYLHVSMESWTVDPSDAAAVRANLSGTIRQLDSLVAKARAANVRLALCVLTAIRERYDPVQEASEAEDIRSMQWYADNTLAEGWWTHTRYARKARRIQEAYIRELGRAIANRMHLYPDTLVAASGDGEVELAHPGTVVYADYSPFVAAEFRDWLRHGGIYASGASHAGQGYGLGARYAGDSAPGTDTNGDGHTLNRDFGTEFTTWNLLHFDWSLGDAWQSNDPKAISLEASVDPDFKRLPGETAGGFDPPRTPIPGHPWWELWVEFKQTLLHHHNQDFARWMTTSADPATGAAIAPTRWYSCQIPADYGYDGTPEAPTDRFLSSMSAWWTGDVWPNGGVGITAYNLDYGDHVKETLERVAPRIAERDRRWGVTEWNPGLLPDSQGVTSDLQIYRREMAVVEQYRPSLLQPFALDHATHRVLDTGFETTLAELVARIKDGTPPDPRMTIDSIANRDRLVQPFALAGWAVDLGKIRGPGRGPGVDRVEVEAYPNPGSGTPPIVLGTASYGSERPAVAATFGSQFVKSGFSFTVQGLSPGEYDLVARARSTVTGEFEISQTVRIQIYNLLAASPSVLRFGATKAGAASTAITSTPAQAVTISFAGSGQPAWTATADQPWLQVSNPSGTGAGQFSVAVANPGNVIGDATTLTGTITVSAPNVVAEASIPVTLRVDQTGGACTSPPFGLVDTPLQNTAGVVGTIGVTGWVLDDVGVEGVKLYRNCLPFEPQTNCVWVGGASVVFVGDATMVAGARTDIEALYPEYPQANRAAWGYLLLTNLLPHVPGQQMFGGQGPLTLYARARDAEGKETWLGRMQHDSTPTSIAMANDSISLPFGAIDTPAQGQTVSGTIVNFGWALTPDANTSAGSGDIVVPVTGSTMRVFIDGVPGPTVAYNQCRGQSASGPVPAGVYCDDDVSSIFGNPAPLATFTPRQSNPTRHRNLDAGRGAIGAHILDTTALANGVHTIVWGVTDSAGRGEGIGSRYFTVLNGAVAQAARVTSRRDPQAHTTTAPAVMARGESQQMDATVSELQMAPARVRGDVRVLDGLTASDEPVWARTGYSEAVPYVPLHADPSGVRHVALPEFGRLDVRLGPVETGYLVAHATLRDLPPGSHLDGATGRFTWTPGLGYYGSYRLAFVRGHEQLRIDVRVRPAQPAQAGESEIRMWLDTPRHGETLGGEVTVAGWALDPQAAIGSGIGAVHVWAERLDAPGAAPVFLGEAALGGQRPDVAGRFGPAFDRTGFSLTRAGLAPGLYDITAYAWNRRTARWEDARRVRAVVVR